MPMSFYHWPMGTFAPAVNVTKEDSMQEINGNIPDARFWTSRKFWMLIIISGVFLAIVLTKTMTFSTDQVLDFLKWLLGFALGTHALTDIASLISGRQGNGQAGKIVDAVGDLLEQALPAQEKGGDSLRSSRGEGSETPSRSEVDDDGLPVMHVDAPMPKCKPPRRSDDEVTPVETPRPRRAGEEDDHA